MWTRQRLPRHRITTPTLRFFSHLRLMNQCSSPMHAVSIVIQSSILSQPSRIHANWLCTCSNDLAFHSPQLSFRRSIYNRCPNLTCQRHWLRGQELGYYAMQISNVTSVIWLTALHSIFVKILSAHLKILIKTCTRSLELWFLHKCSPKYH